MCHNAAFLPKHHFATSLRHTLLAHSGTIHMLEHNVQMVCLVHSLFWKETWRRSISNLVTSWMSQRSMLFQFLIGTRTLQATMYLKIFLWVACFTKVSLQDLTMYYYHQMGYAMESLTGKANTLYCEVSIYQV